MKLDNQTIMMIVVAIVLGMLVANMFKEVCGCKVVEGQTLLDGCIRRGANWTNWFPVNIQRGGRVVRTYYMCHRQSVDNQHEANVWCASDCNNIVNDEACDQCCQ